MGNGQLPLRRRGPAGRAHRLCGADPDRRGTPPACVTVKVCPPIVIVLLREVVPVLAAHHSSPSSLPLPLAPAVTVSQLVEIADRCPAATGSGGDGDGAGRRRGTSRGSEDVGAMVNVHGAPACVTVKVWPPIIIVPVRDVVLVGGALELTEPLPLPLAPAVM